MGQSAPKRAFRGAARAFVTVKLLGQLDIAGIDNCLNIHMYLKREAAENDLESITLEVMA